MVCKPQPTNKHPPACLLNRSVLAGTQSALPCVAHCVASEGTDSVPHGGSAITDRLALQLWLRRLLPSTQSRPNLFLYCLCCKPTKQLLRAHVYNTANGSFSYKQDGNSWLKGLSLGSCWFCFYGRNEAFACCSLVRMFKETGKAACFDRHSSVLKTLRLHSAAAVCHGYEAVALKPPKRKQTEKGHLYVKHGKATLIYAH